jgi:ABC-type polysaccharide/polyol phosphate export permease
MNAVITVYRSRDLLWNLTLRELRTKYRRSFLGWAWSMLNPLSQILIYGFVFGTLLGSTAPIGDPSGLDNFALYLLCGLLPWNFFSLVTSLGLGAVSANAGLVRRVAFPREVLVFSNVLHACVQFSIEMSLLFIVMLIAGSPFLSRK